VRQYHIVQACRKDQSEGSRVVSAGAEFAAASAELSSVLDQTCNAALRTPDRVHASPTITVDGRALRVFARSAGGASATVAAAMVVDTAQLLTRLRIVSADPSTRLIVMDASGGLFPSTEGDLARTLVEIGSPSQAAPALRLLLERMRRHARGTLRLPASEAARLGLPRETAMAIYRPIQVAGVDPWSTAMISSTASVAAHERALVRRMVISVVLIALMLAAMSAFVIFTTRRTIALRERLRRADEIAHLHEKAEKVLDTIPTGVIALAEDGQVTAVNAVLRKRLDGFEPRAALSHVFRNASPSTVEQIESLVSGARESGTARSLFGEALSLFGEDGSYNIHAVPLEPRFPDARVLVVVEDLSMVGSLERQLLRSEKLATLGILTAGIAHEIGTPLGIARGRAEYILGKRGDPSAALEGSKLIIEQIDHVTRTIRKLLDFARVNPTRVIAAVDPAAAARSVAELLELEVARRKLCLKVDSPDILPAIAADADQFEQVLVNLVINACDACEPGGQIRISMSIATAVGAAVRVVVSDDGKGIPEGHKNLVFDPFFTTKKRGQGTGLGLSIVAQIVRNHGATVELESDPGTGTRVVLMWPVARAAVERNRSAQ
jgi:signal transduction histidine kinase